MRTILITGPNGFIGRQLLAYIKGSPAYAADRLVLLTSSQVPGYECLVRSDYMVSREDFLELGIEKVDIFLHLGGFIPKEQAHINDPELCSSNITVTLSCLKALSSPPQRIIYISTVDVYDVKNECLNEESEVNPVSLYGWSKLYTEQLVQRWAQQNQIVCQILRLGHIYGPGEEAYRKLIPQTIRLLKAGQSPVIYTDGSEQRAFLHVKDCCRLIMKAIDLPEFMGPINVASGNSISVLNLVNLLKELMASKESIDVRNTVNVKRNLTFDNAKMQYLLGTELVDLKQGLLQEIAEFQFLK